MKTEAAILVETGRPLIVDRIEIPLLKPGQVLVSLRYSGVCHTQVLEARGHRGPDKFLPHCLGHEGSGVVLETGPGVRKLSAGDEVVLSWIKGAGADVPGTTYQWNGRTVNAGAITTFNRHAVISENRVTALPAGLDLRIAALVGCAVATGMGSVFNTARPEPGQSAVVFGAGGVGLCAVAGAAFAGCVPLVAVDVNPDKLTLAREFGATDTLLLRDGETEAANQLSGICKGGPDLAIEATGRPFVMNLALESVRARGGTVVVIGNARQGESLNVDPRQLNAGKRLLGTWGGDSLPERDFPHYARLMRSGRFDFSLLQPRSYRLCEINQAVDQLEAGRSVRPLIDMSQE